MKIIAENEYARIEIELSACSPTKALVSDEISELRFNLADRIIEALSRLHYARFSVAREEIKLKA